jgi:hypothetical protein
MGSIKTCVYCGEPANTREHVRPRFFGGTKTVPACLHCNVVLGAYPNFTIEGRRRLVINKLLKRLGRLRMVGWSDSELEELGDCLGDRVRRLEQRRLWLERRIAQAKALAGMEQDQPVVLVPAEASEAADSESARNPFVDPAVDRARWDLAYARALRDAKYPRCTVCGYPVRRNTAEGIHQSCKSTQTPSLHARLLRSVIEGPDAAIPIDLVGWKRRAR